MFELALHQLVNEADDRSPEELKANMWVKHFRIGKWEAKFVAEVKERNLGRLLDLILLNLERKNPTHTMWLDEMNEMLIGGRIITVTKNVRRYASHEAATR